MHVQHGSRASAGLDAVRALAAFAVFAGHARNTFFVDHPDLSAPGPATSAFYFATGLGHQAVLVFFVLSGFFIGQAVRARHLPGARWAWAPYLVDRLSRLQIVLLPALLLTLACDLLGAHLLPALYDGSWPGNVMALDVSARHGVDTFALNAVYLQTIAAPTFGSNGPLWSLAYELWYYLLFPLALRAVLTRSWRERLVSAALFAAAVAVVNEGILLYLPVWLAGALLTALPAPRLPRAALAVLPWLTGAAVAAALLFARREGGLLGDYLLGAAVAAWVYALTAAPRATTPAPGRAARLAVTFAAFSYTLYAVHLPFVALLRAALGTSPGAPLRATPSAGSYAIFLGVLALGLAYGWAVSRLTEARTPALRRALRRLLRLDAARPAPA